MTNIVKIHRLIESRHMKTREHKPDMKERTDNIKFLDSLKQKLNLEVRRLSFNVENEIQMKNIITE